jgi:hypothetical protein
MEIRVKVDDKFMEQLTSALEGKQLGEVTGSRITQDALALYKWAVEETSKGRYVVSSDPTGDDVQRVVMPGLNATGAPPAKSA